MEGTASGNTARSRPGSGAPGFAFHSSEEHLQTEKEQDDPACNFERVQVNADGIENDLPGHHCHDKNDRGINRSTQRGATPLRAGKRCRQSGKNCHVTDRINRRPNRGEIFANFDEQRRHGKSGNGLHQRLSESEGKLRRGGSRRGRV
jgi:hypothetical protein